MSRELLGILRDIAAILLCLECAILIAVPGVILFFATKYLRKGRRALRVPLLRLVVLTLRVQHATQRATSAIIDAEIKVEMLATGVLTTARALVPRR
jgi:hypothetical protein